MAENAANGRHRAAGRYNPLSEIGSILGKSAQPAVKSSAVLAASGGLVAALALPAHAAPTGVTAPKASAAVDTLTSSGSSALTVQTVAARAVAAAPAVVAPEAAGPAARQTFGVVGFKAVAKPKPKPIVRVVSDAVSRSGVRTSLSSRGTSSGSSAGSSSSYAAAASHAAASGVIAVARTLLGIYYIYGGSTPAGFDCSGFTSYVFRQVGISLPRTAAAQQASAQRVSNPQPGDLVFFGYPAYHVGIYAGGGMMYDSPTTGKTTGLHKIWSSNVTYGRP